jgi:ABC-type multidrug transport system ATPase subunit
LEVRGVTAHAPNGTRLLDDVTFDVARGEMLAIVGPTGAGKTSLARAITGALQIQGSVRVDGHVAFVPQTDALHAGLTLQQALTYAAGLRLPNATSTTRAARVASVLEELGLAAHTDTRIGDLSGGQRKRASIATVLLGDPEVLVLDEPTAGLDPGYEKVVLDTLRGLTASGRTVITVTHSVDALQTCDRVVFVAAGAVAFVGTPQQATRYFGQDLAGVFLALDSAPQLWRQKFAGSRAAKTQPISAIAPDAHAPETPQGRRQFTLLLRRQLDLLRADRRHLLLLALQAPFVGGLLWAVLPANGLRADADGQYGSKAGVVLLFIVLSATWLGVANAIRDIVRERNILHWEAAAGLAPRPYVAAKFAVFGVLAAAQSAVVGLLATMRQDTLHRGELIALTALAGVAATALGLLLSAASKSTDRASALLPVTLVAQLVLAGEWASSAHFPLLHQRRWVVSTRWTLEAMAGALNGPDSQRTHAVFALLMLTAFCVEAAMAVVARRTEAKRPLVATRSKLVTLALPATGVAVALTLGAGGAAVFALANHDTTTPRRAPAVQRVAAAPTPTPTTAPVTAPPVTTPPVLAAAPVTTPPVTTPRAPRPAVTTPVTEFPIASEPQLAAPETPTTVPEVAPPPVVTPTNTTPTTTSPLSNFFKLFGGFGPKMTSR